MSILIGNNCVVSIHYTLTDDAGNLLDSSINSEPLYYLHGADNLIPGLENELTGKAAGAAFKVSVPPEQGYGTYREELLQTVPLDLFKGVDEVKPGMQFETQGPDGPELIMVTAVSSVDVTVDGNHPLAGKTLHFDVTVESVRDATAEELDHGHPHDGHNHHH